MPITFRSSGKPLSFNELDENFRSLQKNSRPWDVNIGYEVNDIVFYDGNFYLAISDNISATPTDNPTIWEHLLDYLPLSGGTVSGDIYAANLTGTNNGDERYTNTTPTPATIGGVLEGMTFNNMTLQQVIDYILYPELFPTLTAPSNTFVASGLSSYYEVGYQIGTITFSSGFNRGSIDPAYGTSGYRSGLPIQYTLTGSGLNNVQTTSLGNSQTVTNYIVSAGSQSWSCNVTYSEGEQPLSSKGNAYDAPLPVGTTSTITRSTTGLYPFLYGMSADELNGTTLYPTFSSTKLIQTQGNKTVVLNGNLQYIYFAYPATYANLISIIDQNGFNVTSSFTVTTISVASTGLASNYTTNYKVYRTIDKTTVLNNSFQFKFN